MGRHVQTITSMAINPRRTWRNPLFNSLPPSQPADQDHDDRNNQGKRGDHRGHARGYVPDVEGIADPEGGENVGCIPWPSSRKQIDAVEIAHAPDGGKEGAGDVKVL